MIIEWLKFQVSQSQRERFIQQDEAIWTTVLSGYPGFLGKQVWISPDHPQEVVMVIHWEGMAAWKSVPADVLATAEAQFAQAFATETYTLVEATSYQVRKFP